MLVNITAGRDLKLRETREIMEIIQGYAAEDAHVIFGTAYDNSMGDSLRVTVVATGLGRQKEAGPQLVETPVAESVLRTGTDNAVAATPTSAREPEKEPEVPAAPSVMRTRSTEASSQVRALETSGMDRFDIPTYLRKQAD